MFWARTTPQPPTPDPPVHPSSVEAFALVRDLDGEIVLSSLAPIKRGWDLIGGAVEEREPRQALVHALHVKTGLLRQPGRLLLTEWIRADPGRGTPAGVALIWDVAPLTAQERRTMAPARDLRSVPVADLDSQTPPSTARRIRAAIKAISIRTDPYLPPAY